MDKTRTPVPWLRGSLALLLSLFVMAVALPNAGRVVIDRTKSPQTAHIEGRLLQSVIIVVLALLPVVCIGFLGRRWAAAEVVGWVMLSVLVVGAFTK
jgi:hypothetical protein